MDAFVAKGELRRMPRGDFFKLVADQKISKCIIHDGVCCFHFNYKTYNFCASEILKESCQLEKPEKVNQENGKMNLALPFIREMEPLPIEKKSNQFGVYYRDPITRSFVLLGKIIERRKKERGNNFRDLLKKAIRDFSGCVTNPSAIFLLAS